MIEAWRLAAYGNLMLLEEVVPFGASGRVWHSVLAPDGELRSLTQRVAIGLERLRWLGYHRTMFERMDDGAQC